MLAASALTGDDTGLIKKVRLQGAAGILEKKATNIEHICGEQKRNGGVTSLCWGAEGEDTCGAGLYSGVIRFHSMEEGKGIVTEYAQAGGAPVHALRATGGPGARVVSCDARGNVRVWAWQAAEEQRSVESSAEAPVPIAAFQVRCSRSGVPRR
eukprot:2362319-Pleurochrysis_carterae.AAC.1